MEFKDLYLNKCEIVEELNLSGEELEMFAMGMIYGKELKNLPYQYVEEKGVFKAQKTWNKIKKVFNYRDNILQCVNDSITEDGELNLYTKESFLRLADCLGSDYCNVESRYQDYEHVDVVTEYYKLSTFYKELLELVKEDSSIEIATANSCYNYSDFELEGRRYKYTFNTKKQFFNKRYNKYFDNLFVKYHKVDFASEEDKNKYENWQERMKKYEEVKDMVDHAPKMPDISYVYREYIRPTKYCLELIETYKQLVLSLNSEDNKSLTEEKADSSDLKETSIGESQEDDDWNDEEEWDD